MKFRYSLPLPLISQLDTIHMIGDESYLNFKLAKSILSIVIDQYQDLTLAFKGPGGSISIGINEEDVVNISKYSLFELSIPGLIAFVIIVQPSLIAMFFCLGFRLNNTTFNRIRLAPPEYIYSRANIELIGDYSFVRFAEPTTLLEEMLIAFLDQFWIEGLNLPGKFTIKYKSVSTLVFTEFDIYIPAFLIFVLITSSTGVASIVGYEQEQVTIDRSKLSDFPSFSFLFGLSVAHIVSNLLTMSCVAITIYFLGFPFQGNH